ncbi:MAG: Ig-like domain repeat protein [Terriglobales bacterium]
MALRLPHACLYRAKGIGLSAIAVFALSAAAFSQSLFNLTVIPGAPADSTVSINNSGQVAGTVIVDPDSGETQVSLWSRTAGAQIVTIGDSSSAGAINDSGQIVGATTTDGQLQPFLWQAGVGTQIISVPGAVFSAANAINNSGVVVGFSDIPPNFEAFIWSASQGLQPLLPQYPDTRPVAINAASQVTGFYYPVPGGTNHAFLWSQADGLLDLGSLGGGQSWGNGINDQGAVVGSSEVPCYADHGFLWTQASGMNDLSSGCGPSTAWGINHAGWIVGNSDGIALWSPTGVRTNPKGKPFSPRFALYSGAINDFGVAAVVTSKGIYVISPRMSPTITSTPNPSVVGQAVTFIASVNSLVGPPPDGESVQFLMGNKVLGTGTLVKGIAQFTTSTLKAGSHTVGAYYGGDLNYAPSLQNQASRVKQVVNP